MPNRVTTILKVTGYSSYVAEFINATMKDYNQHPNLMCFMEMPEGLRETVPPFYIVEESKADGEQYITQEEANRRIAEYGAVTWYDWCNKFLGTKWGSYDVSPEWDIVKKDNDIMECTISYNTAWGPMTAYLLHVSKMFPTLHFHTQFADEGGGFVGVEEFHNGEIEEFEYDWDSEEGIEIRMKVGYYDEYADEDEENKFI
jgi:hypothetical protein